MTERQSQKPGHKSDPPPEERRSGAGNTAPMQASSQPPEANTAESDPAPPVDPKNARTEFDLDDAPADAERHTQETLKAPKSDGEHAAPDARTNQADSSERKSDERKSDPRTSQERISTLTSSEQPGAVVSARGLRRYSGELPTPSPRPAVSAELEGATSHAPTELALELTPASKGSRQTVRLRKVTATQSSGSTGEDPSDGGEHADGEEAAPRRAETYVGYIIDGRYHVEAILAQGGMGVVYRGRHRLIDKPVAIKVLRPELADNREITQRFLTEAQAASSIGNEHIVDITDYGELPDGATYIVMEFLEGRALGSAIEKSEEPMPVPEILAIARQVCDGLQHAHNAGIVHRDLKPDNIFLTQRGKQELFVKILDFGIAKVASSQNQLTRAGRIFGTPHYMSPEQARGEELDNRADIYSMGVILYEMLSGRLPFEGENPLGILTQHMYTEPRPLHELCGITRVSVGLEAIVSKCLLKEPWQRYASMAELGQDLERVEKGEEPIAVADLKRLSVSPPALKQRLSRGGGRRSKSWLWAVLLVGAIAGLAYAIPHREELFLLWEKYRPVPELNPTPEEELSPGYVALVLSPIDAHVFVGNRDMGPMPVTMRVKEGQRVKLSVRREGYTTQEVELDGTEGRKVIELVPLPGAAPVAAPRVVHPPPNTKTRIISVDDEATSPAPNPALAADAGAPAQGGKRKQGRAKGRDAGARVKAPKIAKPAPTPTLPTHDIFDPLPPEKLPPGSLKPGSGSTEPKDPSAPAPAPEGPPPPKEISPGPTPLDPEPIATPNAVGAELPSPNAN